MTQKYVCICRFRNAINWQVTPMPSNLILLTQWFPNFSIKWECRLPGSTPESLIRRFEMWIRGLSF